MQQPKEQPKANLEPVANSVNNENFSTKLAARGRLVIPANLREQLGWSEGETLVLYKQEDGSLGIKSWASIVKQACGMFAHIAEPGTSLVDQLISERRAEAAKEIEKVKVFDSSAILAFLRREPGYDRVEAALIKGGAISSINFAEVLTVLSDRGLAVIDTARQIQHLQLSSEHFSIYSYGQEDALLTASLRTITRHLGLSLADRACLALGQRLQLPVVTADKQWQNLDIGIEIHLIR